MSPAKPVSNIHATALLLLICAAVACGRGDARSAAVSTTSAAGTSVAPSSASAASRDEALVRVVHAIPNGPAMDLYAGDLLLFDAVNFKSVSNYRAVDGKRYAFALRPAGMTTAKPLSTNTEGLDDGSYYTVFALPGDAREARLRVVRDKLDRPGDGKARLRVVHGVNGVGRIDVHAPGLVAPIIGGIDFQAVTDYAEVAPISGQVEVRAEGNAAPLLLLPNAHVEAGRFYTMTIIGNRDGAPPLEAFIIEDRLAAATR